MEVKEVITIQQNVGAVELICRQPNETYVGNHGTERLP